MECLSLDLKNKIQSLLDHRSSWRFSAVSTERRAAGVRPPVVLVSLRSRHGRRGEVRHTIAAALTEAKHGYTTAVLAADVRGVVDSVGDFHVRASMLRQGEPAVHFEGSARSSTDRSGLLLVKSSTEGWTLKLQMNGYNCVSILTHSGPRDNNDVDYFSVFVPLRLVRAVVSRASGPKHEQRQSH